MTGRTPARKMRSSRKAAVHVAAAADPHHKHQQGRVLNLIDDPVITDTDAVQGGRTLQGFAPGGTRVIGQLIDLPSDAPALGLGDSRQRIHRRRFDLDSVGHFSPIAS